MRLVEVGSAANPHYKHWRRLNESARACREAGRTLAEGLHLAQAIEERAVPVLAVILRAGSRAPEAEQRARRLADRHGLRPCELAADLYDSLAPVERGAGLLLEIGVARTAAPQALAADAIYLAGVQEPGNVGAILRSAAAAGVRHAAFSAQTAFPWSPRALRAGMGAQFALSLYEGMDAAGVQRAFGGERLAADASGGEDLYQAQWGAGPTLWIFGAEGAGLSPEAAALAQRRLQIPQSDAVESLNVAAAAAVCLFEQRRRRLGA